MVREPPPLPHSSKNVCSCYNTPIFTFQGGRSALHYASYSGSDGIVKLLLTKKADATLTAGVSIIILQAPRVTKISIHDQENRDQFNKTFTSVIYKCSYYTIFMAALQCFVWLCFQRIS